MFRLITRIRKRLLVPVIGSILVVGGWIGYGHLVPQAADSTVARLTYETVLGTPGTQDTLERRPDLALHLSWTQDGQSILARQQDGNIISWQVSSGEARAIARTQAVYAYCPTEARLLVNIENDAVLLGLQDGLFRKISEGRHDHAAFSADCSTLAIAREDEQRVRLLRGQSWSEVTTEQPVRNSLMLSLDGSFLAAAGGTYSDADGHRTLLELFDISTDAAKRTARVANPDEILGLWSMAFSADGSGLMLGSQVLGQSGLRHIATQSGETRWGRDGFDAYWVRALAASPDGILIATGDESGHRLGHALGVFGGVLLGRAADLSADRDGLCGRVRVQHLQRVARRCPDHRIPADAIDNRLAHAILHQVQADQSPK